MSIKRLTTAHRAGTGNKYMVRLKIPVNTLMFCAPPEGTVEQFTTKLAEYQACKVSGMFELDVLRINSLTKLKETIALDGAIKVYPTFDNVKGRLYAGTQLGEELVIIQIDVTQTKPPQCFLTVYCMDEGLRAVVAGSVLDIVAKIKC